jgi:hypothetical protein
MPWAARKPGGVLRWSHVEAENGHRREDAELLEQIRKL